MRTWILVAAVTLAAPLAFAETAPLFAYPPQNDMVTLPLMLEDWVQTDTARTELSVDASLPGSDAGKVRADILGAVKSLAQGADWRFTAFDRNQDASGLEHWHAVIEARLAETQLGGLSDRAKQASKPGLQIKVQAVDFTPTLAEVEATRAKLRAEMYKKVNEALAQLNQAEPDRKYRIMRIDFNGPGVSPPMPRMMKTMAAPAPAQDMGGDTISLSEKAELRANVTFAAQAPRE
jgi:hypothetical protein